jgi:hypothetical protein
MRHTLYGLWRILCFYQFVQALPFKMHTLFLKDYKNLDIILKGE